MLLNLSLFDHYQVVLYIERGPIDFFYWTTYIYLIHLLSQKAQMMFELTARKLSDISR